MAQSIATSGPYIARTAEDLTQSLIDYFVLMQTGVTDFTVGSVIRTEFEAVAQLAEQFYADQATQLQDAIAQSAYSAFNFSPLLSGQATGYLVFQVGSPGLSADTLFSTGTTWQPEGQNTTFSTNVSFTIPMNTAGFWHVPANSLTLGTLGNLNGGVQGNLLFPTPGVTVFSEDGLHYGAGNFLEPGGGSVSINQLGLGFKNGRDPETPLELRTRFTSFLSSLHRSTLDALEYGASLAQVLDTNGNIIEQAALTKAIDVNVDNTIVPSEGFVNVYVFNGVGTPGGQVTSGDLIGAAQDSLDGTIPGGIFKPGYKAAGITTECFGALEKVATITLTVTPVGIGTALAVSPHFLKPAVVQAAQDYFSSLKIGDKVYESALLSYIVSVPGVQAVTINSFSFSPSVSSSGDVFLIPTNGIALLAANNPTVIVAS